MQRQKLKAKKRTNDIDIDHTPLPFTDVADLQSLLVRSKPDRSNTLTELPFFGVNNFYLVNSCEESDLPRPRLDYMHVRQKTSTSFP